MTAYYVSKYAPTKGIQEYVGEELVHQMQGSGVERVHINGKWFDFGKGLFLSLDEARHDAIKRTRKKVSLLVKKEAKLENAIVAWESELPV